MNNNSFIKLDISDLKPTAVVPQCLDNQWFPTARKTNIDRLKSFIGLAPNERARKSEYIRSLLSAEQIIVNRAFLLNTHEIYEDFLENNTIRTAFTCLIDEAIIVPYLLRENTPIDALDSRFPRHPGAELAWKKICEENELKCIRLSWDDDKNNYAIKHNMNRRFHDRVINISSGEADIFLRHLWGIEAKFEQYDANTFKKHLAVIRNYLNSIWDDESRYATRDEIYAKFIMVEGASSSTREYDTSKPFAIETKLLIDLIYNTNLPDALQTLTLTPTRSPTRLALQELSTNYSSSAGSMIAGSEAIDPNQIAQILRDIRFSIISQAFDFIDFASLTLSDVVKIRATHEWAVYKDAMQNVVTNVTFLDSVQDIMSPENGLPALESAYGKLLAIISKHYAHAIVTRERLQLGIKFFIQVGSHFIVAFWTKDQPKLVQIGGAELLKLLSTGAEEVITTISIGWVQDRTADLVEAFSIQLHRRKFDNARKAMEDLEKQLRAGLGDFRILEDDSPDDEGTTINQ